MFFYGSVPGIRGNVDLKFQSPEGDSLFFYDVAGPPIIVGTTVSVPRRGFVVFLRCTISYPGYFKPTFQSPEGDSLFFYNVKFFLLTQIWGKRFSAPKGIRCFSTERPPIRERGRTLCFSPPKGIRCSSTPSVAEGSQRT